MHQSNYVPSPFQFKTASEYFSAKVHKTPMTVLFANCNQFTQFQVPAQIFKQLLSNTKWLKTESNWHSILIKPRCNIITQMLRNRSFFSSFARHSLRICQYFSKYVQSFNPSRCIYCVHTTDKWFNTQQDFPSQRKPKIFKLFRQSILRTNTFWWCKFEQCQDQAPRSHKPVMVQKWLDCQNQEL